MEGSDSNHNTENGDPRDPPDRLRELRTPFQLLPEEDQATLVNFIRRERLTFKQEEPRKERKKTLKTADEVREMLSSLSEDELRAVAKAFGVDKECFKDA